MKSPLVVDIETQGDPFDRGLLSVSWQEVGEPHAHVLPGDRLSDELLAMMADPDRPFVSHTKYDARYLRLMGFTVTGPYYDTQVMAWVLNENQSLSLEALARRYCGIEMDKRLRIRQGEVYFETDDGQVVSIDEAPQDQLWAYNARDVEATTALFLELWERLDSSDWLDYYLREEVPFTATLLDMECAGLPIDMAASEDLRGELERDHEQMAAALLTHGGLPQNFNLNSGPHLSAYLFSRVFELKDALPVEPGKYNGLSKDEKLYQASADLHEQGIANFTVGKVGRSYLHGVWTLKGRNLKPGRKTPAGDRPSVASPALLTNLSTATDEWVKQFLGYRKVDKALTTYLRKFPRIAVDLDQDVRIFGRFNQTGTKTGRLSSSDPNLQNIPSHGDLGERIRQLFAAPEQRALIVGDYSQLEPRLMAHFSQDPLLLDVYRNDKDIYRVIAGGIFGCKPEDVTDDQRGIGKTLVLAMGYGAGAQKVAEILTINGYPTDKATAEGYLDELQNLVSVFFSWREAVIARVHRTGYVTTLGGRHRRLKAAFVDRGNWKNVGYGERQAVNAVVQGSAGDIVRRAMVGFRSPNLRLLAQVHDELVYQYDATPWHLCGKDPETGRYCPKGCAPRDGRISVAQVEYDIRRLQQVAEQGHGFDLHVPLKFEPVFALSWADKGVGAALELPEDLNEETLDFQEERAIA